MDFHKRKIFLAWAEHPTPHYEGNATDLLQGRPPSLLHPSRFSDQDLLRQVRRLMKREFRYAHYEWEASHERARGSEWWERYIEGPAEHELKETLAFSIPRRTGETLPDYRTRLHRIELLYRARLPAYERRGLSLADEPEEEFGTEVLR